MLHIQANAIQSELDAATTRTGSACSPPRHRERDTLGEGLEEESEEELREIRRRDV